MDSLTQIVLGSTVAALAVPAAQRRRALVAGAILGTLPDLDTLPMLFSHADAVARMTQHRAASHSLLVLPFVGLLLWWLARWRWHTVQAAPKAWLLAIQLALLTHPILDAFTVYGTQLLWPLPFSPTMWASVWIVDPAYTLPLLAGCIVAAIHGSAPKAGRWLIAGLVLSSTYLLWSLAAKAWVERDARAALATMGLANAPHFSVPMPLNTLLWQVVAMTPQGYLIGERSLIADRKPIQFRAYASDTVALAQARDTVPAVARLLWFNHGFMRAHVDAEQRLIVADLRMGQEPDYNFQFVVAQRAAGQWQPITVERVPAPLLLTRAQLAAWWQRLWHEP